MEKQAFEIRVPGTERILWTNGKRKYAMENPGNWMPAIFFEAGKAYGVLKYAPLEARVIGRLVNVVSV